MIYLFAEKYDTILLIRGYNKNIPDLTADQRKIIKKLADDFIEQLHIRPLA